MTEKGAGRRQQRKLAPSEMLDDEHRQRAFERVGEQGGRGETFPPGTQDIGGTDIAGPN